MTQPTFLHRSVNTLPALPLLLAAQAISVMGSAAYGVCVLWHVKATYGNDLMVMLFAVLGALVSVALGISAGRTADTWDRRWLLLKSDFACILALLVLLAALQGETGHLYLALLGVNVILGMAFVQAEAALLTALPHLAPPSGLGKVNALHQLLTSGAGIMGAVLGGLLASVPLSMSVSINLASFVLSFLLLALSAWPAAACGLSQADAERPKNASTAELLRQHDLLRRMLLLVGGFLLLASPLPALLPSLAHDTLRAGAKGLGLLEAAFGLGAVVGGGLAMTGLRPQHLRALCLPIVVAGVVRLALAATASIWLAACLLVVGGAAVSLAGIGAITLLQEKMPEHERGAALGLAFSVTDGARPLGLALAMAAFPILQLGGVLEWGGAGLLLLGTLGWLWLSKQEKQANQSQ